MNRRRKEHARQEFSWRRCLPIRLKSPVNAASCLRDSPYFARRRHVVAKVLTLIIPNHHRELQQEDGKTRMSSNLSGCLLQTPLPPSRNSHEFLNVRAEISHVQNLRRPLPPKPSRNQGIISMFLKLFHVFPSRENYLIEDDDKATTNDCYKTPNYQHPTHSRFLFRHKSFLVSLSLSILNIIKYIIFFPVISPHLPIHSLCLNPIRKFLNR